MLFYEPQCYSDPSFVVEAMRLASINACFTSLPFVRPVSSGCLSSLHVAGFLEWCGSSSYSGFGLALFSSAASMLSFSFCRHLCFFVGCEISSFLKAKGRFFLSLVVWFF